MVVLVRLVPAMEIWRHPSAGIKPFSWSRRMSLGRMLRSLPSSCSTEAHQSDALSSHPDERLREGR